jgi:predicted outer membrane repeat protein
MSSVRLVVGFAAFLLTLLVVASGGWVTPARADIDHVTNCTDGDAGSLRAVVNAAANGDTVVFDVDCTGVGQITVSTEILVTDKAVTIDGTGHQITISGGDTTRIFNGGHGGTLTLNHLTLTHGAAGDGGAIAVTGSVTLIDTTVSDSSASNTGGGAVGIFGGTLVVQRSTFIGNTAPKLGGAIWSNGSPATIETSTFTQNQSGEGGAIGINAGLLTVSRSTFVGNTADDRGGAMRVDDGSQLALTNSTLTNNTSTQAGGAIFTENETTSTLTNDTLVSNNVSGGGAGAEIAAQGPVIVSNTIVLGNGGSNCSGAITNDGNNLQFGDTTCGFSLTGNPRLGPLADNTGPTQTMALGQGSAAIDGANPAICRIVGVDNIDQRGQFRTNAVRNTCDIGAYDTGGTVVGPASGSTTAISCAACKITVGGSTTITVQAKSASGQSLTVGGDTVTLATTRGMLSAVTDKGNGTYTATLQSPTKPSKATVSGTINGQQITATATVKFTAAAPSAAKTTISARRVNVPQARGKTRIVVDSQDRFGNDIPTGGAKVRLKSTAGKLRVVRDLHNGNYVATLSRNKEEDQKVLVTGRINGRRIKDTAVVFFK